MFKIYDDESKVGLSEMVRLMTLNTTPLLALVPHYVPNLVNVIAVTKCAQSPNVGCSIILK